MESIIRYVLTNHLAFVALIISAIAVYYSRKQFCVQAQTFATNRQLALYDQKSAIYHYVMQFIAKVCSEAKLETFDYIEFQREIKDYKLLFGTDVETHIDSLNEKSREFLYVYEMLKDYERRAEVGPVYQKNENGELVMLPWGAVDNEKMAQLRSQKVDLLKWFHSQAKTTESLFAKYLKIAET